MLTDDELWALPDAAQAAAAAGGTAIFLSFRDAGALGAVRKRLVELLHGPEAAMMMFFRRLRRCTVILPNSVT